MAQAVEISRRVWVCTILIGLSSFLFGYALSALNTVLKTGDDNDAKKCYDGDDDSCPKGSMLKDIDLDIWSQQAATTMTIAGAWIGCMLAPKPNEKYGRRLTLLYNNALFIFGGLLCVITSNVSLFIGRFVIGLATGCESMVVPVLLSEIAHVSYRGKITSIHQLMVTVGIFSTGLLGFVFVTYVPHGWQYMQGFTIIPAVVQILFASVIPESPRWLCRMGRIEEARKTLESLRPKDVVEEELQTIMEEAGAGESTSEVPWREVFKQKRVMFFGIVLMGMTALTGVNSVIFYSTTIFGLAGVSYDIVGTLLVGAINVVLTIVSSHLVDSKGRKTLLLSGTWLMTISLAVLFVVLLAANDNTQVQGAFSIIAVLLYICGFAVGLGAVAWVVISEIVPTSIRSKAFSLFVSINWVCNIFISLFSLSAINGMGGVEDDMDDDDEIADRQKTGVAYLYLVFGLICVVCLVFLQGLPETKGKSVAELSAELGIDENEYNAHIEERLINPATNPRSDA